MLSRQTFALLACVAFLSSPALARDTSDEAARAGAQIGAGVGAVVGGAVEGAGRIVDRITDPDPRETVVIERRVVDPAPRALPCVRTASGTRVCEGD